MTKGREHALRFVEAVSDDENQSAASNAGRLLSPADVRQLTVYAELKKKRNADHPPNLMLLYPFVGPGQFEADSAVTWNESLFFLMPVKVNVQRDLSQALPPSVTSALTGNWD